MGTIKAGALIIFSSFAKVLCFLKWGIFYTYVPPRPICVFFFKGVKGMISSSSLSYLIPLVSQAIEDLSICLL
jgi:hypothetical protein